MNVFYVDFNLREANDLIVLRLDVPYNANIDERTLLVGMRVVLYDEGDEYEAILQNGRTHKWVARIIPETNKILTEEQWKARNRERSSTNKNSLG